MLRSIAQVSCYITQGYIKDISFPVAYFVAYFERVFSVGQCSAPAIQSVIKVAACVPKPLRVIDLVRRYINSKVVLETLPGKKMDVKHWMQ
jgi:hypothetical protein